jgi:Rieske Fe-S protein
VNGPKGLSAVCHCCGLARREWMRLAASATALVVLGGGVAGCGHPTGSPPTGPEPAGNVSELAVGALLVMSNVVVGRDASGIYAMSGVCTHAGCLLPEGAGTIAAGLGCPCHGSAFDGQRQRHARTRLAAAATLRRRDRRRREPHRGR